MLKPAQPVTGKLFEFNRKTEFIASLHNLQFSSDGRYIAMLELFETGKPPNILIWDTANWQKIITLNKVAGTTFDFWGQGKYLAYSQGIYDIQKKEMSISYNKTYWEDYSVSSPSTYLAKGREDFSAYDIYHKDNPNQIILAVPDFISFVTDKSVITAVSKGFSRDYDYYNLQLPKGTPKTKLNFDPPTTGLEKPEVSPRGNYIVFFSDSGNTTHVYDLHTQQKINVFDGAYDIAFSSDEEYIITPKGIFKLKERTKIGDVQSGRLVASPTENYVISVPSDAKNMHIYDITTGRMIKRLSGAGPVFSPDGKMLAFFDGLTMQVWDFETLLK